MFDFPMSPTDPRRIDILKMLKGMALGGGTGSQEFLQPSAPAPAPVVPAVPANDPTGGRSVDEAVSQGFRPPNYVPAAQIAGGSGDYISRVPSPQQDMTLGGSVPPAQTEGGSGNYMSQIGNSPATPPAPIPETQDTSNFSFFGKPEATDALTAFASGMLRGNTFNDGLANAAEGVNKVAKDYRPLTPREIALYEQKARLQRKAQGQKFDSSNPMYDKNGTLFIPGTDANGQPFFYNTKTKEYAPSADGLIRATDADIGAINKRFGTETGKQIGAFALSAQSAPSKIRQYDTMLSGLSGAGVSTDILTQSLGKLAELTGTNIAGINLQDRGVVKNQIAGLAVTAAQALQGQGQISDKERQLLADSLPKIDMNEEAARTVINILKKAEERKIDQYRKWVAVRQANPNADFTSFLLDYGQTINDDVSAPQGGNGSSAKQSLDQIFGN